MSEPDIHPPADEANVAELLDRYLAQLHSGSAPDREELIRRHPELASALECLDALDAMAAPGPSAEGEASDALTATSGREIADIAPDQSFGDYELLEEIGRGGMGVVYKARQRSLERTVAIKMILAGQFASEEHVRRFQAESKAAARVRHPNIVAIHEVGRLHGQDYFVMDHIEGQSLAERIAEGSVAIAEAVRLIAAVARAVDHLHQQGIVHRDLKPSNILLDAEGEPYVTDFGLAKVFAADPGCTATGTIVGTPSYMAPEQASGRSEQVGPTADVYSLGAILYELLTGRPPFREDNPLETLLEVLSREPALPRKLNRGVPRSLEWICLRCLAKSPEHRYRTAGELADDLERFARGEALAVGPPTPAQRLVHWSRRQPALAVRLAALGAFYLVETFHYATGLAGVDWTFHWKMTVLATAWAATSAVCQQFLSSRRWSVPACFVWGTLDSLLLLAVLLVASGAASPMVVAYPLLIAGSALWFRVRFVSFMTLMSLASYGILVVDFYCWRPWLQTDFDVSFDRHVIFSVAILVMGGIIAYVTHRVRMLSTCYGRGRGSSV